MLSRLRRLLRSWIGFFISSAEDPEVMLQQSVAEMRESLPRLNQILVQARAAAIQLEEDAARLEREEKRLLGEVKALLQEGSPASRTVAEEKATRLTAVRVDLAATREKHVVAERGSETATLQVDEMKRHLKEKIEEAQRAIQESRRAETMRKASDALAQLDAYGVGATNEEFLGRVRERSAEAKAAVEIAIGAQDAERTKLERTARQAQGKALLADLEAELGLKSPTPEQVAQPSSIGPREKQSG